MTSFHAKNVLITGGASGIGKLIADQILAKGAKNVIIWDLSPAPEEHPFYWQQLDVSKQEQVASAVEKLQQSDLIPDILILNAGVVSGGFFVDQTVEQSRKMLDVNIYGVIFPAHFLLPLMIAKGEGHVVTIASAASMLSNPRMAVYAATKWAVYGWSESLRLELKLQKTNIHVTTVAPSFIDTGMFAGAKVNPLLPNLKPEKAACKIISGIERNKRFVRMPALVYLFPLLKGLLPASWFDVLIGKGMGVYNSMTHFKGRAN
jgi:short-subunit dehydrogenase